MLQIFSPSMLWLIFFYNLFSSGEKVLKYGGDNIIQINVYSGEGVICEWQFLLYYKILRT